jgi:DNA-binding NtrC family response regulator
MVLAAVDDLLFGSKIRTAAKGLGVDVRFARSADEALEGARATPPPRLVLVDLDSPRIDATRLIPELRGLVADATIVGFVSHVHVDRIEAARRGGASQVMARSLFTQRLRDLLEAAQPGTSP